MWGSSQSNSCLRRQVCHGREGMSQLHIDWFCVGIVYYLHFCIILYRIPRAQIRLSCCVFCLWEKLEERSKNCGEISLCFHCCYGASISWSSFINVTLLFFLFCFFLQWPEWHQGSSAGHLKHLLFSIWRSPLSCFVRLRYVMLVIHVDVTYCLSNPLSHCLGSIFRYLVLETVLSFSCRECQCWQLAEVPSVHLIWDPGQSKETVPPSPLPQGGHHLSLR